MKMIHTADVHFDEANKESALKSLDFLAETAQKKRVDLITVAGDLFNSIVYNNETLNQLIAMIRRLLNIAPIVAVQGTATHDVGKCYDVFLHLREKCNFTLLQPGVSYFLNSCRVDTTHEDGLLILGCPEPSKSWFLKDKRMGREEANQAIIEGMRGILLGCGALRKQYAALPCLFVYHGSVVGASLGNGQKMRPGEIASGRDDLAMVGADYIALGHFHEFQKIEGLPAFYSGSAYPCNWGERDQKCFNLIEFKQPGEPVDYTMIPFPHPPRKKITYQLNDNKEYLLNQEIKGFQVWLEIIGSKEELSMEKIDDWEKDLYDDGALRGSRVTTSLVAVETVRAAEITEKKTLPEKIQVWGDASGTQISDSVKEKASQLESEAKREGIGAGAYIQINRLGLRGATGIYDALALDEIDVDFSNFDEGLICLQGQTGSGKSTILENCQPFNQLLTRSGKIQDHFRLKDSYRDLYFTDKRTETEYRAFILIDGATKNGKAEPILYKKSKGEANYEPITNGRVEDYNQKIKQTFGSLNLFLRSAFAAQDQTQRMDKCTKGEKKELFRELAGLDYLQTHAEHAGNKVKECEKEITEHQTVIRALEPDCLKYNEEKEKLTTTQREFDARIYARDYVIKPNGERLKKELEQTESQTKEQALIKERIKSLELNKNNIAIDIAATQKNINSFSDLISQKSAITALLTSYESLEQEYNQKKNEALKMQKVQNEAKEAYLKQKSEYDKNIIAIDRKIDAILWDIKSGKSELSNAQKEIDRCNQRLNKKITCPKCQNEFSENEKEIEADLEVAREKEKNSIDEICSSEKQLSNAMHQKESIFPAPKAPQLSADYEFLNTEIIQLSQKIAKTNIKALREQIENAKLAQAKIDQLKLQIDKLTAQQADIEKQLISEQAKINTEIEKKYDSIKKEYEQAREDYTNCVKEISSLEATIKALGEKIHDLANKICELDFRKESLKDIQAQRDDWSLLEQACGPDGIQALELDALAPNISAEVNSLLESSFGSRFKIEIETTRIAGKGSKTKQVEDFSIWVNDDRRGSRKLLENMSGGEKVLINRTICDAFGIINDRNTGMRYLTYFMDEADDGLDPEMRQNYFRIMETAHGSAHRYQTVVITHSREIQQMIQQKIIMTDLKEANICK